MDKKDMEVAKDAVNAVNAAYFFFTVLLWVWIWVWVWVWVS